MERLAGPTKGSRAWLYTLHPVRGVPSSNVWGRRELSWHPLPATSATASHNRAPSPPPPLGTSLVSIYDAFWRILSVTLLRPHNWPESLVDVVQVEAEEARSAAATATATDPRIYRLLGDRIRLSAEPPWRLLFAATPHSAARYADGEGGCEPPLTCAL